MIATGNREIMEIIMNIPLDPGVGGMSLHPDALQPADIIVSTTNALVSRVIRTTTASQISHAMLYAGNGNVIEAIDEGVVLRPLTNALNDAIVAVAYRKLNLPATARQPIVQWARSHVGKPYDLGGAAAHGPAWLLVLVPLPLQIHAAGGMAYTRYRTATGDDRFFCSQLVVRAFESAGHPIIDGRLANMNPQQLVRAWSNGKLGYLGHLLA